MTSVVGEPVGDVAGVRIKCLDPAVPVGEGVEQPVLDSVSGIRTADGGLAFDVGEIGSAVSTSVKALYRAWETRKIGADMDLDNPLTPTGHEATVVAAARSGMSAPPAKPMMPRPTRRQVTC